MRIALVCIQERWGHSEGPEEKASRYTVRPGTVGLTLLWKVWFSNDGWNAALSGEITGAW